jgi:Fic family protein
MNKNRAGKYIKQLTGYKAYIPNLLPPDPPIRIDNELHFLLSNAEHALARLDGVAFILPNPELFVAMFVKKEALLSSQIEGTQASLEGVLEFESDLTPRDNINEIKEVINYIKAMDYGMKRLKDFPMSSRLIKEIHSILLEGVRGTAKTPGEFRRSQNWIGPAGASLLDAVFVPPPHEMVNELMSNIEKVMHSDNNIPPLIRIAIIHAQFETIHPFLDGNGRIGRLLITFYIYWKEILEKPLLYLSFYFKKNKEEYYRRLMDIRLNGDWENWLKFFLKGVIEVSKEAVSAAKDIIMLKEKLTGKLFSNQIGSALAAKLLDQLFENPIVSVSDAAAYLKITRQSALQLIKKFVQAGILKEITGKQRYRKYIFLEFMGINARGTEITEKGFFC